MLRRTARRDRLVGLFIAGALLLNPPILNLVGGTFFGWPVPFLYAFGVWALLIAGIALVSERGSQPAEGEKDNSGQ
jgi:hypothetical protein